jgi:hypothetical protein
LRRCRRRRSGLPARLIATLFVFLCGVNLNYGSLQSVATKPRIGMIQKIKEAMGSFNRDTVAKVCKSLMSMI